MKNISFANLEELEKDAVARFEIKKAEAVKCEQTIKEQMVRQTEVMQEIARIQGEFKAIQNLKKQAEGDENLSTNEK